MAAETEERELDAARVMDGVRSLLNHLDHGTYYVAEIDGKLAGQLLITFEWSDWRNGNFWWIQSVFVREDCRAKGVFRALLDHVRNLARTQKDVCGLRLYVDAHNERAQRAYERLGFARTDYLIFEQDFVLNDAPEDAAPSGSQSSGLFDGISVQPMNISDYDAVVALWQSTEGVGLNESDTREAIESFLRRNPGLSCVARTGDGAIAGAVLCGHDGRRGYLHHLAVAREYRRRGIGRALLEHCFSGLAAHGIPKCNIFLFDDNGDGRSFWQHNGWNDRADLRVMQKKIGSSREVNPRSC